MVSSGGSPTAVRLRLSQPPAGDWLAGAWAELGKKKTDKILVRHYSILGIIFLYPLKIEKNPFEISILS